MPSPKQHTIIVCASTERISDVREFVAKHATNFGFSDEDVHDIRLAVDEAYTNVVKHAYHYDNSKKVEVTVKTFRNEFLVSISDEGTAFDFASYKEPNIEERIMLRKRGGVGVYLIRKLMDRVEYRTSGRQNEILMSKKR
ncbi:MAG: ATP-binding protein [Balneolales bacterium]|nr:ATP-binding protein [Balneolales bacterium]